MKNLLEYYYDLYVDNLNKINTSYYFKYDNKNYVLEEYKRNINEIEEIFEINNELNKNNYPSYIIILTKFNSILSSYNNKNYLLMIIPNIKNREIIYEDLLKYNIEINKEYKYINKSNWQILWENKIDYIEYQFSQIENKYPKISESINYYIGLWENAITYKNYIDDNKEKMYLSINRINKDTDILSLINPKNFIIDTKMRIIGDYLKAYVINTNWTKNSIKEILNKAVFDKNDVINLISRIIFPSYYFDIYEDIIENNKNEEIIQSIINKNKEIINLIEIIQENYKNYNIPIINWIKKEE